MDHCDKNKRVNSLVNPDLTGLWSCALLKDEDTWLQGLLALQLMTFSWVIGTFLPLWALHLLYLGARDESSVNVGINWNLLIGTCLMVILAWPFVVTVKPWYRASRFWLSAASYFEGGCSMSYEERKPDNLSIPQMQCYHPHGIFTLGVILNSGIRSSAADFSHGSNLWKKYCGHVGPIPYVGLAAEKLVQMPLFRHIMVLWTGNIESASKKNMVEKMQRQESFGICPGGFHELALFLRGRDRVYMKKTGFIYYALKYGYMVTPAYTFGECQTFYNVPGIERFREKLADLGLPAIFVTGPFNWIPPLSFIPYGRGVGLHTIHGKGRQFPKVDQPSKELVAEYSEWYCGAVRDLFDRHKHRFGITHDLEVL